jgi:hypothetical protein
LYTSRYIPVCSDAGGVDNIITDDPKGKAGKTFGHATKAAHAAYDAKADANSRITPTQEIFEDARGYTYRSVRYCDLERICDK